MNNDPKLVSVIVPVYNIEKCVEKCILSILNQTYRNLEILLVDDGSTDHSGQICDFYAQKDSRIRVLHQKNMGLVSARKRGLHEAKGQYIGFVDGDDYIDQDMYADMLEVILESKADFVHTGYFEENGNSTRTRLDYENAIYDIKENRAQFLQDHVIDMAPNNRMGFSIWSKLFKRDLIISCYEKVPDGQSYGEDVLTLYACILESDLIYMRKKAFYHYVRREDSITNDSWIKIEKNLITLYQCMTNLLKEYNLYTNLEEAVQKWIQAQIIETVCSDPKITFCCHRYFYPDVMSLQEKKIVLYGAGTVGQDYYAQICKYPNCRLTAWVDKSPLGHKKGYLDIITPEELKKYDYDILIIGVNNYETAEEIKRELLDKGIDEKKICWLKPQYFMN